MNSFAILRRAPAWERFEVLHPGRQAAAEKARQGAKKGAQNAAYKQAMVGWQDGFQRAVAAHFGLTAWPWKAATDAGSLEGRAGAGPITGAAGAR